MTTKLLKILGIASCVSLLFIGASLAQEKQKALVTQYGVTEDGKLDKGVFKKECFLSCQKTYDEDMIKKCKEEPGKINKDISVLEEGGCFDKVKLENDKCISVCFIGKPGTEAVKAYEVEEYKPVEPKAKADASKKSVDDDLM